jgi:hypothetical protein
MQLPPCHAVICCDLLQEFHPLAAASSRQSLSSLPDLPHSEWASTEGRRQLHDYQLQQQQQQQVLVSCGQGGLESRQQSAGGSSMSSRAMLDTKVSGVAKWLWMVAVTQGV